jgi:predicted PurR-regulated permease PerM
MIKPAKVSYIFIATMFVLIAGLGMATPLLTALFGYFALSRLHFVRQKWITLILFTILVLAIFYGFVFFLKQALVALPEVVERSVPSLVQTAERKGIQLPFDDVKTLKELAQTSVKTQLRYLGNFAKIATKEFVFLVIGLVVAMSIFVNPRVDFTDDYRYKRNLYTVCAEEIVARFSNFYHSFATVMGAQIMISTVNTVLTAMFVLSIQLKYSPVIIGVTFLCGLLPIVGNIISNSVIVGIVFAESPQLAVAALVFLVVLHKLEYFLNSKFIGDRIKNPIWLTLLGLILAERLMGIPGMILAPVILHYVKTECSQIKLEERPLHVGSAPPLPVETP